MTSATLRPRYVMPSKGVGVRFRVHIRSILNQGGRSACGKPITGWLSLPYDAVEPTDVCTPCRNTFEANTRDGWGYPE